MRLDMHVHTHLCGHAEGDVAAMVGAARRAGVETIAITDHLPLPEGYDPTYAMRVEQLAAYVAEVRAAALESEDGVEVLLGVEADWIEGEREHVADLLAAHPFDVVIGSIHFIDGWAFDDPALIDQWDVRDVDDVWRAYFARFEQAAASGLFDVMAHPDLVKKFGHRPSFDPVPLYRSAARILAGNGVAVEVSTAGLRKPVGELYPSREFLTECFAAGVAATTGSDAHTPDEVGYRLDAAEDLLRYAGYERLAVFRSRRMEEVAMGVSA